MIENENEEMELPLELRWDVIQLDPSLRASMSAEKDRLAAIFSFAEVQGVSSVPARLLRIVTIVRTNIVKAIVVVEHKTMEYAMVPPKKEDTPRCAQAAAMDVETAMRAREGMMMYA